MLTSDVRVRSMYGNRGETLPVWPALSTSPMVTLMGWSTIAEGAFEANRALFSPAPLIQEYEAKSDCPHCVDPYKPLPGLLALHLRRGDFIEHCPNLCRWGAAFLALNQLPGLPDQWDGPSGSEDERMAVYLRRCLPTHEQIVEKVRGILATSAGQGLKNVYVMTNGDREWLAQLKAALMEAHAWEHIATSRDLAWTPEEKYVSQATDMLIGERAQVFVGNGVSVLRRSVGIS